MNDPAWTCVGNAARRHLTRTLADMYLPILETPFLNTIVELAGWRGWLIHHCRPARVGGNEDDDSWRTFLTGKPQKQKWRTPIQGHKGFPDLFMLRRNRAILAELKSARGKTTEEQDAWLLGAKAAQIEAYVWRPKDMDEIERILT